MYLAASYFLLSQNKSVPELHTHTHTHGHRLLFILIEGARTSTKAAPVDAPVTVWRCIFKSIETKFFAYSFLLNKKNKLFNVLIILNDIKK